MTFEQSIGIVITTLLTGAFGYLLRTDRRAFKTFILPLNLLIWSVGFFGFVYSSGFNEAASKQWSNDLNNNRTTFQLQLQRLDAAITKAGLDKSTNSFGLIDALKPSEHSGSDIIRDPTPGWVWELWLLNGMIFGLLAAIEPVLSRNTGHALTTNSPEVKTDLTAP